MWTLINLFLTLDKRSIVKQGTLDYFCLPGHLRCFVNRRVKQQSIMEKKKKKKKSDIELSPFDWLHSSSWVESSTFISLLLLDFFFFFINLKLGTH